MIKYSFLLIFALSLFSCGNNTSEKDKSDTSQKTEVELMYDEIMAVHDEVMPLMGTIVQLNKDLRISDSLNLEDAMQIERMEAMDSLKNADDAMMDWMYQFDQQMKDNETYLKDQKLKVDEMAEKMLNSIKNAEQTIEKIKQNHE